MRNTVGRTCSHTGGGKFPAWSATWWSTETVWSKVRVWMVKMENCVGKAVAESLSDNIMLDFHRNNLNNNCVSFTMFCRPNCWLFGWLIHTWDILGHVVIHFGCILVLLSATPEQQFGILGIIVHTNMHKNLIQVKLARDNKIDL